MEGSTLRGMSSEAPTSTRTAQPGLGMAIARYALARIALISAVAALLVWVGVPLLVALLVALVAAVPLSMMLLPRLRSDLSAALAEAGARRSAQRARLRAQLRGDAASGEAVPGDTVPGEATPEAESSDESGDDEARGGEDRPDQHDQAGLAEHRDEVPAPGSPEDRPHR